MDLAAILVSQYLASLEMLKQAIILCPEPLWNAPSDRTKFWHITYHALFFTHLYLEDSEENFTPWIKHRDGYEDISAPQVGRSYDKEAILEYLAFCQQYTVERVPRMNLEGLEGHGDKSFILTELQIYNIRHIMQHTGTLMERLISLEEELDWVGSKHG